MFCPWMTQDGEFLEKFFPLVKINPHSFIIWYNLIFAMVQITIKVLKQLHPPYSLKQVNLN